jgi:2-polyprenyl-3-methyl-5-hydroxy-6-metoxy-1,4-benzoquinol methylase
MSKSEHDTQAAIDRPINYEKPYFRKTVEYLRSKGITSPKILDIGAGNGEFAEMAREFLKAEVTCHDYAEPHLERIRGLGFKTLKLDFDNAEDVRKIAEEHKEKFDVVTAFELIEHIFGLDDFLTFAHKVLKPGGLFIISTPNLDHSFYHIHSLFVGNIPMGEGHHVRFFNRRRLTQALVIDGFNVIDELSYGRGHAYWHRIVGEAGKFWELVVRGVGRAIHEIIPNKSSKKYSKLMVVAQKVDVPALGYDQTWRMPRFTLLTEADKRKIFERLIPFRRQNLFKDMTLFRKFFDEEYEKIHTPQT